MAQAREMRPYYNFVGGLDTEANELDFPENHSFDEENFELMPGGFRRRRYGLGYEPDNASNEIDEDTVEVNGDICYSEFSWRSVGGSDNRNWIVQQVGNYLYFFDDVRVNPSARLATIDPIDVTPLARPGASLDDVASSPLSFTHGRGRLIVAGKYVDPFYVEYVGDIIENPEEDIIRVTPIEVRERDFEDVSDGIPLGFGPFDLSDSHKYNLMNRGWRVAQIEKFEDDLSYYPAKNMILSQGLQRSSSTPVNPDDGIKQFSPDKLVAELFQDVSAPKGFFVIDPLDTTDVTATFVSGGLEVTTWNSANLSTPVQTVTLTLAEPHSFSASDEVIWRGARVIIRFSSGMRATTVFKDINEVATITGTTADTITFSVDFSKYLTNPSTFIRIYNPETEATAKTLPRGTVTEDDGSFPATVVRPFGQSTSERFRATEFFAGRAWFAGCSSDRNASRIYFSQIVEVPEQFGKCYQAADPTDVNISDLIASDGGVIVVPDLGTVTEMKQFASSLLVFTQTGVWEISGGQPGQPFTALGYNVRRLSDAKVFAPKAICESDGALFYGAADGIHMVRLDPRSGILVNENISEQKVQNLWMDIPSSNWNKVKAIYDPVNRRVWMMYSMVRFRGWRYDEALILDTRLGAYFKYRFHGDSDNFVAGAFTPRQFCCTGEPSTKFLTITNNGEEFTYSEQMFPAVYSSDFTDIPLVNPNFTTDLTGWTTVPTGDMAITWEDGAAFMFTATGSSGVIRTTDAFAVTPGEPIRVEVKYRSSSFGEFQPANIVYFDASDNFLSITEAEALPPSIGAFVPYTLRDVVPAGAATARVYAELAHTALSFMYVTNFRILSRTGDIVREIDDQSFTDWGNTVPAYLITGAEVLGDASRKKQAPTVHTFMRQTETGWEEVGTDLVPKNESGCFMQSRWEWADDPIAGKWTVPRQIYKLPRNIAPELENGSYPYRTGHPVRVNRERLSGMGRAITLKFESDGDKPCILLGWSADYNVNQLP